MKRTNVPIEKTEKMIAQLQRLGAMTDRLQLAGTFGLQYGGDRKIYQALGYKQELLYEDFARQYIRQDIAKAVIDRPVAITWRGPLALSQSTTDEKTTLEKAFIKLEQETALKTKFIRLDKLTSLGRYGVLLLGLDDIKAPEDWSKPVESGTRKLLYLKPLSEKTAVIESYVADKTNERYGLPEIYDISFDDSNSTTSSQVKVHYSRVLHILSGNLESDIFGTPSMEAIFNRLMDLEKITGGSAEMYWRGARPGYQGKLDKDFKITAEVQEDLQDQINEYENNLRRMLINKGISFEALETQVSDPKPQMEVQISAISAEKGIPKRILMGSERGELSSAQDKDEWYAYGQTRREEYAEPAIVRPFVDRMIEYGILPGKEDEEYTVKWKDLFSVSDKEKADIGKIRAEALRAYSSSPYTVEFMPPEAFTKYFLGFDDNTVEEIDGIITAALLAEQKEFDEAKEEDDEVIVDEEEEKKKPPLKRGN